MKRSIKTILTGVVGVALATTGLWSCSAENPFDEEGTGTVHLRTVVNTITTRVEDENDTQNREQELRNNCVVYVSSVKGLIFKAKGLDNVPESMVLKTGRYVAEAWSGDSVTASFDKMFFRAYEPFEVQAGNTSNVVLNCKIQNVVVSINTATIDPNLMKDDYVVTVKNTRGELTFDKNNAGNTRGYFMMPNNDDNLEISITGTRRDGRPFTKTETITNVKRAHHYILNFAYNPEGSGGSMGAVFLKINIKEENLNDTQNVTVPTGPTISGVEFNVEKQQVFNSDDAIPESGLSLKLCAFGDGYDKVNVATESWSEMGLSNQSFNILGLSDINISQCNAAGLSWTDHDYKPQTNVSTMFVTFSKEILKKLTARATEHQINIEVIDKSGQSSMIPLRIARSEEAIILEDPIVVEPVDTESNQMNLTGSTATLSYSLADDIEGTPGVEYKKTDDPNWTFVAANVVVNAPKNGPHKAQQKYTITLTGLEPGTEYQYRACCGDFHGDDILTFTTEEKFIIPNASFEEWSTYSAKTMLGTKTVTLPGNTGDKSTSFWGSGNEGAATANMTLTNKSTDMIHSGQYSACLESKSAMGVIAAGNIFIGEYVKTDGTNGVLSLGREYNGTHPAKVRVHANYRPGNKVSVKSENTGFLPDNFGNGNDHGQIYVALTTAPVEIRTNPNNRKLFDAEKDETVLAYGQVTWTDNFGPDGQLQEIEIPFEYNDRAKTKKPTHLVIVCSASKYGDYFSGSAGSKIYLDDFELVY